MPAPDFSTMPLPALIRHLEKVQHPRLRNRMRQVAEAGEALEADRADDPAWPRHLCSHLRTMHRALREHFDKEELVLFPLILAGRGSFAGGPIHCLETEHHDLQELLGRLRRLTGGLRPPAGAPPRWSRLYRDLAAFEEEILTHSRLENEVLFPRALCEEVDG